jgi:hypothetical protein
VNRNLLATANDGHGAARAGLGVAVRRVIGNRTIGPDMDRPASDTALLIRAVEGALHLKRTRRSLMRRIRRLFSALVIAGASWVSATPSFAAQPSAADQPPPADRSSSQPPATTVTQKTEKISATATVVSIDAQQRDLTLRGDDGTEFTVEVPRSVQLDRIHEGDRVKLDYYEAIGLSLTKPQPGARPRSDETTITQHNAGALPSGTVAHRITASVEVVRVDRAGNRLTVRRPDGTIDTINVTEPAIQSQLANVHEGDRIQVSYTEAVAIRVMPQKPTTPHDQPGPSNRSNPDDML